MIMPTIVIFPVKNMPSKSEILIASTLVLLFLCYLLLGKAKSRHDRTWTEISEGSDAAGYVGSFTHIASQSTLIPKVPRHVPNKLDLLVHGQAGYGSFQDTT